jgi:hypothetical protein
MRRVRVIRVVLMAGMLLPLARPASAQVRAPGYGPATPTLSPWLNLYQKQAGPVDNYHMFVQPQIQLQNTLRQQELTNQRQTAGMTSLGQQMTQMEQDRQAPVHPTGTGSVYMSYLHYYPALGGTGHGTHLRTGQRTWTPKPAATGQTGR